jgi:hypothetical protein
METTDLQLLRRADIRPLVLKPLTHEHVASKVTASVRQGAASGT